MRRDDGLPEELVTQIIFPSVEVSGNYQPRLSVYQFKPETYSFIEEGGMEETNLAYDIIQHLSAEYLDGEKSIGEMPMAVYQLWNALDWRKPHDEPESAQRFTSKLQEELLECLEAFEDMQSNPDSKEQVDEFVSELGDVLFCATACATIARADVENGTAREMLQVYGQAVRYPYLSHIDEEVRRGMNRRDDLFPNGQFPYEIWNLYNHEDEIELDLRPAKILPPLCFTITSAISSIAEADIVSGHGIAQYELVEALCGKLNLFVSLYAQHYADSSLEEVVAKNISKISGRVVQGSLEDRSLRSEDTFQPHD